MVINFVVSLFYLLSPLQNGPKSTRLRKIYISTYNYSLSEVHFSPRWINTLGHLLLAQKADSPVYFTILTNIISSNPRPHMGVIFIFCSSTLISTISIEGEEQGIDSNQGISNTTESINFYATPNIF